MYLKALEIKGFKSFLNKTVINFPRGMISIVGPNGSGKSNILDAVRWVLGEQSIKQLRGDKLEDVIFSGSQDKSAVGVCEVTLIIDNEDGMIDTEYSEVAIKRKAYRTGESKFFINDKACRLKDIKELLLDTGIGKEGYSIISQGKIDEIVGASSSQKRTLLEEASGITKYRYKKEEGEKNLDVATENLERITDIYKEIEIRVKPLEEQKIKAEKYLELTDKLKKFELNKFIKTVDEISEKRKTILEKKSKFENSLDTIKSELTQKQTELNDLNIAKESSELVKQTSINELQEKKSDIKSEQSGIELKNETIRNLNTSNELLKEQIEKADTKSQEKQAYINEIQEKNKTSQTEIDKLGQDIEQLKADEQNAKQLIFDIRNSIKKCENEKSDLQSDKSRLEARMQFQKTNIDSFKDKISEYLQKQGEIEQNIQDINSKINTQKEQITNKQTEINHLSSQIEQKRQTIYEIENKINDTNNAQNNLFLEQRRLHSETEVLKKLEQSMQGFSKGIKAVLQNTSLKGVKDIVANVIKVKPGYEKAIEQLISGRMDNIIIDTAKDSQPAINFLKQNNLGRATFLPIDTIKPAYLNYNDIGVKAIDVVDYDEKYAAIIKNILGKMVIVENMNEGLLISKKYQNSFRIATKDGDLFNVGGSITGGSTGYTKDVFSRRSNIAQNEEKISNLEQSIQKQKDLKQNFTSQKESINSELENLLQNIKLAQTSLSEMQTANIKLNADLDLAKSKKDSLNLEHQGLSNSDTRAKKSLEEDQKTIDDINKKIAKTELKLQEEAKKLEHQEKILDKNLQDLSQKTLELSNLIQSKQFEQINIDTAQKEIEQATKEKNSAKEKFDKNIESIKLAENEILELQKNIDQGQILVKELEEKIQRLEETIVQIKLNYQAKKAELDELNKKNTDFAQNLVSFSTELDKVDYKLSLIEENIKQSYDISISEIYDYKDDNLKFTETEIKKLKSDISSLGNVNIDSIEEFEKVNERYIFYKTQKEDLEASISQLRQIIKHLEKDMISDFKTSFNIINKNFSAIFSILFGGGSAKLILADETDVLGSDIELSVQPPGKKLKGISMLSGGEKALAAIALLFAIISQKAVPFCILDEIDAPLDDANIFRFVEYLQTLKDTTQFITITHRRNTMEASDYMYAVFMQQKGISEVVSISLSDVSQYAQD